MWGSPLSCGDVLVHHAIALGLHTTVLVLLKAALNGRSSKLMPDKGAFGYGFPCDGPGRGGTCDHRECGLGLDVPFRSLNLGDGLHVPVLGARVLARAD